MLKPIVEILQGKLCGRCVSDFNNKIYYSFQGIPYAKPPIGALRFKPPVAAELWEGIRDATKAENICIQKIGKKITGSEDCLYLNVYTPEIAVKTENIKLKPVLVFIHGGSFKNGSGGLKRFGPDFLITENVVIVTFNYRLGFLGFLNFDNPKLDARGNVSTRDAILVLQWVQTNIIYFSGDPNNVTVAGNSSGAPMAHSLMFSPLAKNLFHKVILQGGSLLCSWAVAKNNPKNVAKILGFHNDNDQDILKFLRSVPATDLVIAAEKLTESFGVHKQRFMGLPIENINECAILSKDPVDIIKSEIYNNVPMLLIYSSNESAGSEIFHGSLDCFESDDFQTKIPYYFNIPKDSQYYIESANKLKRFYCETNASGEKISKKFRELNGDMVIVYGMYLTIKHHLKNLNCPIYVCRFSLDTRLNVNKVLHKIEEIGACHSDETGYLFKTKFTQLPLTEYEEYNMKRFVHLYANYLRKGNPNPIDKTLIDNVVWEPVNNETYNYLDIGKVYKAGANPDMERVKILDKISSNSPYKSNY